MSASESEHEPFIEDDNAQTHFTYDDGGLPFYIGMIWISVLIGFTVYVISYMLPDLAAWFGP